MKHSKNLFTAGKPLHEANKVLIMIHGRGGSAQDILGLASHLNVSAYSLIAPQATNRTWYPYSFLAEPEKNEPWLSSALDILKQTVDDLLSEGIPSTSIYFLGFSQGACLTLDFIARNPATYGGIAAFTGGLIGDNINSEGYSGDLGGTPIFIGTGNPDPHVPVERIHKTAEVLQKMHADLQVEIYEGKPHSISQEELDWANKLIFKA